MTPRYVIRYIRAGTDHFMDAMYEGTKPDALAYARDLAEHTFPGAKVRRGGGDAYVAHQDGEYVGTVSVEPWAAWRGAEPEGE